MASIKNIHIHPSLIMNYKGEELSASTKIKLEALGIDPTNITTEAQAQVLIAQAEAAQSQNNSGRQRQGGNPSREQLVSEARNLAKKVRAPISDFDTLEDMLEKISETIQLMAQDPSQANFVDTYQNELNDLAQKAGVIVNIRENIFNSMEMVSLSNKLILGL